MDLTRRDFIKKSAILAGGVAVATAVPSVALAEIKKEAPAQLASVTTGYAQVEFDSPPFMRRTLTIEEFEKHFRVTIDSVARKINLYQIHYIDPVDIYATPCHIHYEITRQIDDPFLSDGILDITITDPTYRLTDHIVYFNDGWSWGDGQCLVFDNEYICKWALKDNYHVWRKPEDIVAS